MKKLIPVKMSTTTLNTEKLENWGVESGASIRNRLATGVLIKSEELF